MLPSRGRIVNARPFDQIILDFHCRILRNPRNCAPHDRNYDSRSIGKVSVTY
jgi:hypothetical protein